MTAQTKGLLAAVGAYLCWGFMPLYWALFGSVRGWEVIGHRVLWSLVLGPDLCISYADRAIFRDLQHTSNIQKAADSIFQLIRSGSDCGD